MSKYVDGFVVPVSKRKLDAYRAMARKAGRIWKEHGALEFVECVADDVKPKRIGVGGVFTKLTSDPNKSTNRGGRRRPSRLCPTSRSRS